MANVYKFINASGSSNGGGGSTPYIESFNASSSWGSALGGFYSITIPQTTHLKSNSPIVQVHELIGGVYEMVDLEIEIVTTGDVIIKVTENLDTRFAGRIVIA